MLFKGRTCWQEVQQSWGNCDNKKVWRDLLCWKLFNILFHFLSGQKNKKGKLCSPIFYLAKGIFVSHCKEQLASYQEYNSNNFSNIFNIFCHPFLFCFFLLPKSKKQCGCFPACFLYVFLSYCSVQGAQ